MENVKIILDNGIETSVNGIFYVFNSKYYFIYTTGEMDENDYVKLYVVQVCKEIKNTPTGPIDTGYMLGLEISDPEEWKKVQESITKIVADKKNGTQDTFVQYLPMNMVVNLKIVSKNKFKLMKHIIENDFKVILTAKTINNSEDFNNSLENNTMVETGVANSVVENNDVVETNLSNDNEASSILNNQYSQNSENVDNLEPADEVIIDYRSRFFEEQQKNIELQEQNRILNEKLNSIKDLIG